MLKDTCCTITSLLGAIELQLSEAAGLAAIAEIRMRIIGQLIQIPRHHNCTLETLVKKLKQHFKMELGKTGQKQLGEFQNLRNNLAHGNYVELMKGLKITPKLRKKDLLTEENTIESIKSIKASQGFQKFIIVAREVIALLDGIIKGLIAL